MILTKKFRINKSHREILVSKFKVKRCTIHAVEDIGVANGLSKMLSLGKFTPSLGISALKNSVSESRISGNRTVSESRILKIWISESRILKIWISKSRQWDFNFLSASLSETSN